MAKLIAKEISFALHGRILSRENCASLKVKTMLRFTATFFISCLLALDVGSAQNNNAAIKSGASSTPTTSLATKIMPPLLSEVGGKVLAITKTGDLKPARFAEVFVLSGLTKEVDDSITFSLSSKEILDRMKAIGRLDNSPIYTGSDARDRLDKEANALADLVNIQFASQIKEVCDNAVNSPRDSVLMLGNDSPDQVVAAQTDEQGVFKVGGLKPGVYKVLAFGLAGGNYAFWVENLTLEAGKSSSLKLHSPILACPVE